MGIGCKTFDIKLIPKKCTEVLEVHTKFSGKYRTLISEVKLDEYTITI
jgi:hypothetical protein